MSDDGAEFVESGSLRVDRPRALEKLRRYQLGDPRRGVLFWLRCACAAGAKFVNVEPGPNTLVLTFDGRPLARADLRDPYGALFVEDAEPRGRQLALGMLWAMRLEPSSLELESGEEGRRLRLSARGLAE
ncbi:MAG: hypothetical protein KGL53_11165, partial [Elusimicrobia bacterium]|nr:hypothetical protein [Elusimicrobiota bacterium]